MSEEARSGRIVRVAEFAVKKARRFRCEIRLARRRIMERNTDSGWAFGGRNATFRGGMEGGGEALREPAVNLITRRGVPILRGPSDPPSITSDLAEHLEVGSVSKLDWHLTRDMITAHTVLPDSMVYVRAFTVLNDDAFSRSVHRSASTHHPVHPLTGRRVVHRGSRQRGSTAPGCVFGSPSNHSPTSTTNADRSTRSPR